ncbi:MAG: hypothetical protein OQL19_02655 [Gammaproteobacteria bacterium]|nr:hypothetical protein [Gammaproteobacteria bacterium]
MTPKNYTTLKNRVQLEKATAILKGIKPDVDDVISTKAQYDILETLTSLQAQLIKKIQNIEKM